MISHQPYLNNSRRAIGKYLFLILHRQLIVRNSTQLFRDILVAKKEDYPWNLSETDVITHVGGAQSGSSVRTDCLPQRRTHADSFLRRAGADDVSENDLVIVVHLKCNPLLFGGFLRHVKCVRTARDIRISRLSGFYLRDLEIAPKLTKYLLNRSSKANVIYSPWLYFARRFGLGCVSVGHVQHARNASQQTDRCWISPAHGSERSRCISTEASRTATPSQLPLIPSPHHRTCRVDNEPWRVQMIGLLLRVELNCHYFCAAMFQKFLLVLGLKHVIRNSPQIFRYVLIVE